MRQPLASPSGCLRLPLQRALAASGRRLRRRPRSGRVFNQQAVEAALRKAIALWGRLGQAAHPNGALIFCSESHAEAVHPPCALRRRVYSCGRRFDTAVLREQLAVESAPVYGVIVIDGSEACVGAAKGLGSRPGGSGCAVSLLARVSSTAASRTRRGGQSALRYSRLREEADLAFTRRVVEKAVASLQGVRAVVLAGKGDARHRLQAELPPSLRSRVLCNVALPCDAGPDSLRLAVSRAGEAAIADGRREGDQALARFMDLACMPVPATEALVVYGRQQTLAALELGALDTLLLPSVETERGLKEAAGLQGTPVFEVDGTSEQGAMFLQSFAVGGCLRWPLDPELLEEEEHGAHEDADSHSSVGSAEPPAQAPRGSSEAQASRGGPAVAEAEPTPQSTSESPTGLTCWLRESLQEALGEATAVESLVMCAEVLLGGDCTPGWETLSEVADLLVGEGAPQAIVDEWVRRSCGA